MGGFIKEMRATLEKEINFFLYEFAGHREPLIWSRHIECAYSNNRQGVCVEKNSEDDPAITETCIYIWEIKTRKRIEKVEKEKEM